MDTIILLQVVGIVALALLIIFLPKMVNKEKLASFWEKFSQRLKDITWPKMKAPKIPKVPKTEKVSEAVTSRKLTFPKLPTLPSINWRKGGKWAGGLLAVSLLVWVAVRVVWPLLRGLSSVRLKAPSLNWNMPPFLRVLWTFVADNPFVAVAALLLFLSLGIRLVYWKWTGEPTLRWRQRSYWTLFAGLVLLLFSFGVVRMDATERAWYEGKLAAPQSDDNRLQLLVVQDSLQRALLAERRRGDSLFQLPRTVIMGPPQESTEHFVPPRIQKTNVPLVQKKKGKMPSLFRCHKKNTTKRSPRVVVQDNRYQF
ncbi:hypothetical protein IT401_01510 [Candidatus Nomurabacteria bacterium]|nr:hypothetical protein [Candidatus Nomurabacteria bacterium]